MQKHHRIAPPAPHVPAVSPLLNRGDRPCQSGEMRTMLGAAQVGPQATERRRERTMGTQRQDAYRPRTTLFVAGALLALIVSTAGPLAQETAKEPAKPDQIVVNDSGGAMGTWMRKAYFDPFEKAYGIRVVETSPTDFGKLRAMVESGNVEWTVTE